MKLIKEALRKIIQEELQSVLKEQSSQFNFKLLDKVMLSKNRLGSFRKCETGGGFMGLKMGCMGKDVATMQSLINKWFEKNVPEAQEWKNKTGKAIIVVDGLYGKDTAEALAYVYNSKADKSGPVMKKSYDAGVDRVLASLDSSDLSRAEREVSMATSPKAMVARRAGTELGDFDRVAAKASEDTPKPTASPTPKKPAGKEPTEEELEDLLLRNPELSDAAIEKTLKEVFKRFR
jgi:hypothetical protein